MADSMDYSQEAQALLLETRSPMPVSPLRCRLRSCVKNVTLRSLLHVVRLFPVFIPVWAASIFVR